MNQTGLRMMLFGLLDWSRRAERRKRKRLRNLRRSMEENKQVSPIRYTIEIKVD